MGSEMMQGHADHLRALAKETRLHAAELYLICDALMRDDHEGYLRKRQETLVGELLEQADLLTRLAYLILQYQPREPR